MKRIVSLLLLLVLAISLTACTDPAGKDSKTNTPVTAGEAEPFSIRNNVTWGMTRKQVETAEAESNMSKNEGVFNEHWRALAYYPAPVEIGYVFQLLYMFGDEKLSSIIYDSGSDVGANEYTDMIKAMNDIYGAERTPETAEVLKVLDVMLPGMYNASNVVNACAWKYGTDTDIYMFKYQKDMFIIMYVNSAVFAE